MYPDEVLSHIEASPGSAQVGSVVAVVPDRPYNPPEELFVLLLPAQGVFMRMFRHAPGVDPAGAVHPLQQLLIREVRWLHGRAPAAPYRVVEGAKFACLRVYDILTNINPPINADGTTLAPRSAASGPQAPTRERMLTAPAPPVCIRTRAQICGAIYAIGGTGGTTAFLEKGEPFRERSPQHSVSTKGFVPCASQPMGPSFLRTALESANREGGLRHDGTGGAQRGDRSAHRGGVRLPHRCE